MALKLIVSSADGFVDTSSLTGWFPARNIYINNSGTAVLGNDNRLKETTKYDLQQVVVSKDRFQEWLLEHSVVMERLAQATDDSRHIPSATAALEQAIRGHELRSQAGPRQAEAKVQSDYTATISDTPTVVGDHNQVAVRNEFKARRVHVDLLDCVQRGWTSPRSLVEALTEPDPGPKTAHLVREIGRSTRSVPSELLTMTHDYSVSSTTLCRLVDDVTINGATTTMLGSGNKTVNREFSRVGRPSGSAVKSELAELRTVIYGIAMDLTPPPGADIRPLEDYGDLFPSPTPPEPEPPAPSIRFPGFGL